MEQKNYVNALQISDSGQVGGAGVSIGSKKKVDDEKIHKSMYWLSGVPKTFRNHQKSNPDKILHRNYVCVFPLNFVLDEKMFEKSGGNKKSPKI